MNRRYALAMMSSFIAAPAIARPGTRISIRNVMGDVLEILYDGQLSSVEHDAFDNLARDRRQNISSRMDGALIDILQSIVKESGENGTFTILSGYRTMTSNKALPGAVNNSFHLRGQALDISRDGMTVAQLGTSATEHSGGLGLYNNNGFVHIDTGPRRRWDGTNRTQAPSLQDITSDMLHNPFKF